MKDFAVLSCSHLQLATLKGDGDEAEYVSVAAGALLRPAPMQNDQDQNEFHECNDGNSATNHAKVACFLPPGVKVARTRPHRSLFNVRPNAEKMKIGKERLTNLYQHSDAGRDAKGGRRRRRCRSHIPEDARDRKCRDGKRSESVSTPFARGLPW